MKNINSAGTEDSQRVGSNHFIEHISQSYWEFVELPL